MFNSSQSPSFFDIENQLDKIHGLNNFLVCLNFLVNWDIFIDILATLRLPRDPSHGGRSPFDALLMFQSFLWILHIWAMRTIQSKTI
ncbi:MAG: hypothetical protein LBJ67_14355 [Planctomycetaceae bacterium]|jgi:hypothetical protein|nr:hypothetical protein [Planctomycetaceae bacterium]